ncbi:MAG: tRNA (adenosine(37)-N6)-threonylcarbamoyltransferase complex ATPase subunit type 1 TsaE [Myxococcota bacterium]
MLIIVSDSSDQTEAIGACLAKHLAAPVVITLEGDLGAGKTCFVRGLVWHFDPKAPVSSPTYALAQTYETLPPVHHIDLYRVPKQDLEDLGILHMIEDPGAIVCIEWPTKMLDLGERHISINFSSDGISQRQLDFKFCAGFSKEWLLTLERDLLSIDARTAG